MGGKNNGKIMILLYGLATATTTLSLVFALVFYDSILLFTRPYLINPQSPVVFPSFGPNTTMGILNNIYALFNIASFTLLWISTILLLQPYYSIRWGNRKFWTILSVPLVFFLSQFVILSQPAS